MSSIVIKSRRVLRLRDPSTGRFRTAVPGEYLTTPNQSIRSAGPGHDSLMTPLTNNGTGEHQKPSSELRPGLLYSQAVSRTPSPPLLAAEENSSRIDLDYIRNNILYSSPRRAGLPSVSMEEIDDEDDHRQWTTVHRLKKARDGAAARGELNSKTGRLDSRMLAKNDGQSLRANSVADYRALEREAPLSVASNRNRASARSESPFEEINEGSSSLKRLGKTVDPLNWGALGIDPEELRPETQREILEIYRQENLRKRSEELHVKFDNNNKCPPQPSGSGDIAKPRVNCPVASEDEEEHASSATWPAETQPSWLSPEGSRHKGKSHKHRPPRTVSPNFGIDVPENTERGTAARGFRERSMEPVAQVEPDSYLGVAFAALRNIQRKGHKTG